MNIRIISFTKEGAKLSNKVASVLNVRGYEVDVFGKYPEGVVEKLEENIYEFTHRCFEEKVQGIIFIGALGIAVRAIAPNIVSKEKDPAVIVMDDKENFIISVLSGHIGGANDLVAYISEALGIMPVITTATDNHKIFAIDTWAIKNKCIIVDISKIKYVSSALLRGEKVGLISDYPIDGQLPLGIEYGTNYEVGICISENINKKPFKETLNLIPKEYILGVGCRRNISTHKFEGVLNNILKEQNISVTQIRNIASIDIKAKEEAILKYCKDWKLEFSTYSPQELMEVEGEFTASTFVKSITGVDNVCERAAQKSGEALGGRLILKKTSCDGVTAAISKINWRCRF